MTTPAPTGRLICRAGTLAGQKFDISAGAYIGADAGNRAVVSPDADLVLKRYGRIYATATDMYLESLTPGALSVDGTPVTSPLCLGRMHVISTTDGEQFMFTRVAAAAASAAAATPAAPQTSAPQPTPPAKPAPQQPPPQPTPEPAAPAPRPEAADLGHTVVDMVAFGALPQFARPDVPMAPPAATPATPPPTPPPTPHVSSPAPTPPPSAGHDAGHTVVDMIGFGSLPQFEKPERVADASPPAIDQPPTPPTSSASTPTTPAASPPARAEPDAAHTVVDMVGFGSLPTLRGRSQASPPTAIPVTEAPEPVAVPNAAPNAVPAPVDLDIAGTVAFVRPETTPYELCLKLPDGALLSFPLKPGDNTIGRSAECDITVADPEMWLSRRHAIVRVQHGVLELVDLKGKNGSFVNGQRIDSAILMPGSEFVLGPHFEFKLKER